MKLINKETQHVLGTTDNPKALLASHYNFTLVEMHEQGNIIEVTFIEENEVKTELWEVL